MECLKEVQALKYLRVSDGLRRNSSFSDMFEGDLSQNLLSRRHFKHGESDAPSETVNAIVSHIRDEKPTNVLHLQKDEPERKKRLSEVDQSCSDLRTTSNIFVSDTSSFTLVFQQS